MKAIHCKENLKTKPQTSFFQLSLITSVCCDSSGKFTSVAGTANINITTRSVILWLCLLWSDQYVSRRSIILNIPVNSKMSLLKFNLLLHNVVQCGEATFGFSSMLQIKFHIFPIDIKCLVELNKGNWIAGARRSVILKFLVQFKVICIRTETDAIDVKKKKLMKLNGLIMKRNAC